MTSKADIDAQVEDIFSSLGEVYSRVPPGDVRLKKIRLDILELLERTLHFLNENDLLGSWQKQCLVDVMSGLFWFWLYKATTALQLAVLDQSEISPDINVAKEVSELKFEDFVRQLKFLKAHMQDDHSV